MRRELVAVGSANPSIPGSYLKQHEITLEALLETVADFNNLKVCVIGDLIVDEYISCTSLGMSQEDPSLVVSPFDSRRFLGGAGIVSAHASALGASSSLISIIGADECEISPKKLEEYGVQGLIEVDDSRPTTLKPDIDRTRKPFYASAILHKPQSVQRYKPQFMSIF